MEKERAFIGRINEDKKKLIIEFEEEHPYAIATIGYGSGVIEQLGSDPNDKKQIDIIDVVEDLEKWIYENMSSHPEEFTKSTLKYFKKATLEQLEKGAPIIYFSSIEYKGELIKRGVISKKQFLSSCYKRTSSYVPFRLEKAVELIRCDDEEIYDAMLYDHQITLIMALLMLPKENHNLRDLMERICSLSYIGDFRMKIHCEDPNKIKNIVDKQFKYFVEDYSKVNFNYFESDENGNIKINYSRIKEDLFILPKEVNDILIYCPIYEDSARYCKEPLETYFKEAGQKENLKQAVKGIRTVGVEKAFVYGLRKIKKGMSKK